MSQSLKSILDQLNDGKKLTLSFPSPKERENFRVALHKLKKDVDDVFLMTDPDYEVEVLSFEKHEEPIKFDANSVTLSHRATIHLQSKDSKAKRGYTFTILGSEDGDQST